MCPAAGQSSKCFRRIAARRFTADARGIVEDEQRVLMGPFGAFAARNEVRGQKAEAEAEAEARKMRAPSRISLELREKLVICLCLCLCLCVGLE